MEHVEINKDEIIRYWFAGLPPTETPVFWFDQSPDAYITQHYKSQVDRYHEYEWNLADVNYSMALLIIGDQFTRNIYRGDEEQTQKQRVKNDTRTLQLALQMIAADMDLTVPLHYRYVMLLPLRHAKQSSLLHLVCQRLDLYVEEYQSTGLQLPKSLVKFYTHTIQNYTALTDEIILSNPEDHIEWKDSFETVLEPVVPPKELFESIGKVHGAISQFSEERIGVSFSGGVDSVGLLTGLKKVGKYVVAIHVEYVNREEASVEREYLQYYCATLGIPLYYRTIHYMKRKDAIIDRNVFEKETRDARFNLYKYVIDKEKLSGICMGHHMGDMVENVFTNMFKGRDTSDLTVMKESQIMYDVQLFRPFLSITKDNIFDFAHYYCFRYFRNTTPDWSCRGVMRNKVLPAIKGQFGEVEANIIAFAEECAFLSAFYKQEMARRIEEVQRTYCTRVKECPELLDTIQTILLSFMHRNGYHMVSKKSLETFSSWYKGDKKNQLQLSKDVFCYGRKGYVYLVNETKIVREKYSRELLLEELDGYMPQKLRV